MFLLEKNQFAYAIIPDIHQTYIRHTSDTLKVLKMPKYIRYVHTTKKRHEYPIIRASFGVLQVCQ